MIPKLEVKGVSCSYHRMEGETLALSHIEFTMNPGEFLAIAGPSGCGKSTLLSLICGLLSPDQGKILLDGKEVTRPGACLGPELSGSLTSERKEEIAGMLSDYGLGAFLHSRPSELSGGMRQRAALIRTLALKPDLLLLDEPFSALDYQTRLAVSDDISTIIRSANKTAILVTHDLSEAISIADRVLVLTKRPGQVKAIVPIRFESEKGRTASPLERRNLPEFAGYFNQLWKEIQTHE